MDPPSQTKTMQNTVRWPWLILYINLRSSSEYLIDSLWKNWEFIQSCNSVKSTKKYTLCRCAFIVVIVPKHKTLAAQCGVGWLVCCCFQVLKVILSEFEVNWHELPAQRRAFKVCWGNYVQTNQKGQNYRLVWQLAAVSKKGGLIAYSTRKKTH